MPRLSGRSSDCLSIDNIYHSALFSDCKTVSLKTLLTAGLNPQAHYNLFPPDTVWSHHEETRELPGQRDNAGTMPGARRRGRPRTAMMDNIKTWTGLPVEESIRITEINGESTSVAWPTVGSRTAKEQNRTACDCDCAQPCIRQHSNSFSLDLLMHSQCANYSVRLPDTRWREDPEGGR